MSDRPGFNPERLRKTLLIILQHRSRCRPLLVSVSSWIKGIRCVMEKDNTVKQAGGFIIQLMPFTEEAVIGQLEKNLAEFSTVTKVLDEGKTPEEMLQMLLAGMDPVITEQSPCEFRCDCSRHRVEKAIISIGKKDIQDMIDDGQEIEVNCHFCNTAYKFSVEELKGLLRKAR